MRQLISFSLKRFKNAKIIEAVDGVDALKKLSGPDKIDLILFLFARVPLLFLRQPFYDELFTQWISAKSFAGILDALRFDSGPPLYYWLLHLLGGMPLFAARTMSLVFSAVALVAILGAEKLGESRFAAAALIAVFPPAVLFSVDARGYA